MQLRDSLKLSDHVLCCTLLPQCKELVSLCCAARLPHIVVVAVELMHAAVPEEQAPAVKGRRFYMHKSAGNLSQCAQCIATVWLIWGYNTSRITKCSDVNQERVMQILQGASAVTEQDVFLHVRTHVH
jgi:hypothetical protein